MRRCSSIPRARWALTLLAAWTVGAAALPAQGRLRQLVCRGGAGIDLKVQNDTSPRDPTKRLAGMVLEYKRNSGPAGSEYQSLEPGACTWNPNGWPNEPPEPGVVYFDIQRHAQPWTMATTRKMDTTIDAAVFFPDTITLPRYLRDPGKYWSFYVNDSSHVSNSFGAYRAGVTQPTLVDITGSFIREPPRPAAVSVLGATRELRCRGGPIGLTFTRGASAEANLVKMTLAYRVYGDQFGPTGRGVEPGMCAWVERDDEVQEPGRVEFTTAANAQLRQIQSGSAVDRTPTAAERWPDAATIPAYMRDPGHFWSFTVARSEPAVARAHAAWKPSGTDIATAKSPAQSPTTAAASSLPSPGTSRRDPATASRTTTSVTRAALGIRDLQVRTGLDGASIIFTAGPDLKPTVEVHTAPPTATSGGYHTFGGAGTAFVVQGTNTGDRWRYTAASSQPLARGTRYWYVLRAPGSDASPNDERVGEFRTIGQYVKLGLTEIYLVSDGDADSNGELVFPLAICPFSTPFPSPPTIGKFTDKLDWGDGPHRISAEMVSDDTVSMPDRFRLLIVGIEDDVGAGMSSPVPRYSCASGGDLSPGRNSNYEWNSIAIDFDLTRYPGRTGGEQFFRRSKPLRDGSTLMFEVRGYIQVTRQ